MNDFWKNEQKFPESNDRCRICDDPRIERHHIVSGNSRWDDDWNIIPLCAFHHRYSKKFAPHVNNSHGLTYKLKLQHGLFKNLPRIVKGRPPWIRTKIWMALTKHLGNEIERRVLVKRMMGGKFYFKEKRKTKWR